VEKRSRSEQKRTEIGEEEEAKRATGPPNGENSDRKMRNGQKDEERPESEEMS